MPSRGRLRGPHAKGRLYLYRREKIFGRKVHGSLRKMFENASFVLDGRREAELSIASFSRNFTRCPPRLRRNFIWKSHMSCSWTWSVIRNFSSMSSARSCISLTRSCEKPRSSKRVRRTGSSFPFPLATGWRWSFSKALRNRCSARWKSAKH